MEALDPSFGTRGQAELGVFTEGMHVIPSVGVVVQPGGGVAGVVRGTNGWYWFRLTADGRSLPPYERTYLSGPLASFSPEGATDQAEGRLLIAGSTWLPSGLRQLAVAALSPEGAPEDAFGQGGIARVDFSGPDSTARAIVETGGRIVAGGSVTAGGQDVFALAALRRDGSLDPSFGNSGLVRTPIPGVPHAHIDALLAQTDARIVAVGSNAADGSLRSTTLAIAARYTADGRLDTSFGAGTGIAKFALAQGDIASGLAAALQPPAPSGGAERLVIGGAPLGNHVRRFRLLRLAADGALDRSFGSGGQVTTDFGESGGATALLALPDGRLIASGQLLDSGGFSLARYLPDGALDKRFGGTGRTCIYTRDSFYGDRSGTDTTLTAQPGGRVVVSGAGGTGDDEGSFTLVRIKNRFRAPIDCFAVSASFARHRALISAALARPVQVGFLVLQHTYPGSRHHTRTLGLVRLGRKPAGLFKTTWNMRVAGQRLRPTNGYVDYSLVPVELGPGGRILHRHTDQAQAF